MPAGRKRVIVPPRAGATPFRRRMATRRSLGSCLVVGLLLLGSAIMTLKTSPPHPRSNSATIRPAIGETGLPDYHGLQVMGGTLQNAAGQVARLHGVNRSSWEYTCFDGSGLTHDGTADQTEVSAMASWNINAVRVVLNEDCWLGINGVTVGGAAYQTAVSNYVTLLTQNNIVPIINLHFSAPGVILAGTNTSDGKLRQQFPMPDRDHSPAFWTSVATAFKDNSMVLFEPYNEPFPDDNHGGNISAAWTCWRDGGDCPSVDGFPDYTNAGMQELVNAIRETGATNVIILTGTNWGSQVDQLLQYLPADPLVPAQLAAGWHSYGDGLSCQNSTCWNTTLASVIQKLPLVATEIGEFDCDHSYIDRVMSFLDSKQQGYLAWAWGPYDCAQEPALITNWAGSPTPMYGRGFHDHLLSLAGTTR